MAISDRWSLCSRIDNDAREKMRHLRCLCFLRPSPESIQFVVEELREPRYGEYNICQYNFSCCLLRLSSCSWPISIVENHNKF